MSDISFYPHPMNTHMQLHMLTGVGRYWLGGEEGEKQVQVFEIFLSLLKLNGSIHLANSLVRVLYSLYVMELS